MVKCRKSANKHQKSYVSRETILYFVEYKDQLLIAFIESENTKINKKANVSRETSEKPSFDRSKKGYMVKKTKNRE